MASLFPLAQSQPSSGAISSTPAQQGSEGNTWIQLEPIWQSAQLDATASPGIPHRRLSPVWQLLVLGDGYTTRNLSLLSGQPIGAHILESLAVDPAQEQAPAALDPLGHQVQRRQVWLGSQTDDIPLLYATSWWNQAQIKATLPDPHLPIGTSLMGSGLDVSRQILGLWWGHSPQLEHLFGYSGPFWGRHYWLMRQQQPLTLIYEVFSPHLSQWLGDPC
ncbi:MAG: DUF98 domain-containing protein [Synechococcaceae cyanobacterium RM1_1_27]|nr:DUF98 domain-containing protein [Synechococcaceae cyanobacterium SM2_3_2]NJO86498.1 DUF98 domain-containing protein [Synechococcaceae cyanobacterium RM1_1_27]